MTNEEFKAAYINGDWELLERFYTESIDLLKESVRFMNLVPNNKYGDNYKICSKIDDLLKSERKRK